MSQLFSVSIDDLHWGFLKDSSGGIMRQKLTQGTPFDAIKIEIEPGQLENIKKIFTRAQNQIFVARDGELKTIDNWEWQRYHYWWNCKEERAKTKKVVSHAIRAFDQAVAGMTDLSADKEAVLRLFLEDIFCATMTDEGTCARMRSDVFDRDAISMRLENGIAARIAPEVGQQYRALEREMQRVQNASSDVKKTALSAAHYALRNAQALFSKQLGVQLELIGSGGSGGARTGHALSTKAVVVVKPGDEGPYGANTPSWWSWLKQFVLSVRKCLLWQSEPRAEEASSRLAEVFKFHNTPHTRTEEVVSGNFNGPMSKECSQQIFCSVGTVQPLGEYLGVAESWNSVPRFNRSLLADHLARRAGLKKANYPNADAWWQRALRWIYAKCDWSSHKPLPNVDPFLLELSALAKFLTGDIDTHDRNILVAELPNEAFTEGSFLDRYFGKGSVTNEEIATFLKDDRNIDLLLARLFESRVVGGKHQALLNHDGGAAFPNQHPSTWGLDSYLSGRHRFLFETHPDFENPFSEEAQKYIIGKEHAMLEFMVENAFRELIGVIGVDTNTYRLFREDPHARQLFKRYVLLGGDDDLEKLTRKLLLNKFEDHLHKADSFKYYDTQFRGDLKRIHGMTNVTADLYRFALHHMTEKEKAPKRELFLHIDAHDFNDTEIKACTAVREFDGLRKELALADVPQKVQMFGEDVQQDYAFYKKQIPTLAREDFILWENISEA